MAALCHTGDQTYHVRLGESDQFSWDWQHKIPDETTAQGPPAGINVMPDLAYAMRLNPKMKVLLTGRYYDQATPFFEAICEMHHLPIPQKLQANISYRFYSSGHLVYLHTDVLKQLHADVSSFINSSKDGSD
jgi:carboxypeptidase C (cathepsin A)